MKKILLGAATALLLTSCTGASGLLSSASSLLGGSTTTAASTSSNSGILSSLVSGGTVSNVATSLLSSLIGNQKLTTSDLEGSWSYTGVDCVFESENLLKKAGGEVVATQLENQLDSKLQTIGIKPGSCSFTFTSSGTYTATIAGKTLSGNYTLDSDNSKIKLTYLAGLGKINASVAKTGNQLSILFPADKLLSLVSTIGSLTGNSTVSTLTSLVGSYDGLLVGLQMQK